MDLIYAMMRLPFAVENSTGTLLSTPTVNKFRINTTTYTYADGVTAQELEDAVVSRIPQFAPPSAGISIPSFTLGCDIHTS
jgi:hypothetical protein